MIPSAGSAGLESKEFMRRIFCLAVGLTVLSGAFLSFDRTSAEPVDRVLSRGQSDVSSGYTSIRAREGSSVEHSSGALTQQFPPEKAREVLEAVEKRHGKPLPGYVGGRTFQNRERKLPAGHYREYDVSPKIPGRNRGPERIVIEQRTGKAYYTGDHYDSFIPLN